MRAEVGVGSWVLEGLWGTQFARPGPIAWLNSD